jgi:hypothetical protein
MNKRKYAGYETAERAIRKLASDHRQRVQKRSHAWYISEEGVLITSKEGITLKEAFAFYGYDLVEG